MKKTTTRTAARRQKTTYVPVTSNVYYDGGSYRVRATVDGVKYSKNFSNKKTAIQYRNSIMGK